MPLAQRGAPTPAAFPPDGVLGWGHPMSSSGSNTTPQRTVRLSDPDDVAGKVGREIRAKYRPALTVMSGQHVGLRKTVDGNVLVGRDPSAALALSDAGVSWNHAMLEDEGGEWVLVDLSSTNGSFVNGKRVARAPLASGDKLTFGHTHVRFEIQDSADEAYSHFVAQLINIDDLTGLYLRRRFDTELGALVSQAMGSGQPLGLLAMDLDGLKAINDQHGHLFGAYTIGEAGKLIGKVLGGRGIACRFGGDEYIAALPSHDRDATVAVGEEILAAINGYPFEREGIRLHPGISIGAAALPADASTAEALFQRADEALYRAKRAGKNRVCV